MNTGVLEDIGLSKNEIIIFLTLLETGETKAGNIIAKSKLQSSAVYNGISSLIEKGLLSYIKKSQVKYYNAATPESILDYIDNKKKEFLSLLPELKQKQKKNNIDEVEFFKSYRGIKTLICELTKDSKKGDIYRFFSIQDFDKYSKATRKVYEFQKNTRKEAGLLTKGIFHEKTRTLARFSSMTEKRFINFPMPPNTQIVKDKVAIISWEGEQPSGILIKSEDIAKSYIDFFEHIWNIGKE